MKFNGHRLTQQWWLPFLNEFYATIHKFPYINPLRLFIALTSNNIETIAAKRDKNDYNLFPRIKTGTRMSSSHFSPTTIFIDLFFFSFKFPLFFLFAFFFLGTAFNDDLIAAAAAGVGDVGLVLGNPLHGRRLAGEFHRHRHAKRKHV